MKRAGITSRMHEKGRVDRENQKGDHEDQIGKAPCKEPHLSRVVCPLDVPTLNRAGARLVGARSSRSSAGLQDENTAIEWPSGRVDFAPAWSFTASGRGDGEENWLACRGIGGIHTMGPGRARALG